MGTSAWTPVEENPAAAWTPVEESPPARTWVDSAKDVAKEWWDKVNPVTAVQGLAQAGRHPFDTGSQMLQQQGQLAEKAKDAFDKGNYVEGIRHFLNYLVPVLGPQTDVAGDLAQSGEYAKAAGQTLGLATNIAAPELSKGAIRIPTGTLPESMYQSALKPSTTIPAPKIASIVRTGLEQEIPVSAGGIQKISSLIDDLNAKIKAGINAGSQQGVTVNPYRVASRLSDTAQRFATQVTPEADLNAVTESGNEFLRNQPGPIPAAQAQAMKQGTYQQLSNKAYGELGSASVEAQKALARGLKEELANAFPELSNLNAAESKLYDLQPAIEKAVQRIGNHQLIGIGTPAVGLGMKAATGSSGVAAAASMLKLVVDNPYVKSRLAIMLHDASKGGLTVPVINARIAAYSDALGNAQNKPEEPTR